MILASDLLIIITIIINIYKEGREVEDQVFTRKMLLPEGN
jgi:hypothetical protein